MKRFNKTGTSNKAECGNVVFIILLGIFLFGLLTFSVTKTTQTGEVEALSEDKAALYAAEIMQYANAIKEGVGRMQLMHGVKEHEFDFGTGFDDYVRNGTNTTCTTNKCRLFHPEGGAVKPRLIPTEWFDPESIVVVTPSPNILNEVHFYSVAVNGVGTDEDELVLVIIGLHRDICDHINLKMANITGSPDHVSYGDWEIWDGPYTSFPNATGSISPAMYEGQKTFCTRHSTMVRNFVHVLIER